MPVVLRDRTRGSTRRSRPRSHDININRAFRKGFKNLNPDEKPRRSTMISQAPGLPFPLRPAHYGLIQERICASLYALVVQAILWNQTRGEMAQPILFEILATYQTPLDLSRADRENLTHLLRPIGLHNIRAARLIALGKAWVAAPPCKERRYRKLHYPSHGCGTDVKPGEVLGFNDEREGWEIAHLPGMGAYALDSYRIFFRDTLLGPEVDPRKGSEWKRVVPSDKELKPYIEWRWASEMTKTTA